MASPPSRTADGMTVVTAGTIRHEVFDVAQAALDVFGGGRMPDERPDAGPTLLAVLLADPGRATGLCLRSIRAGLDHDGLSVAGAARFFAGAHAAAGIDPRLTPLATRIRSTLTGRSAAGRWRTDAVGWSDYDLISGPAGLVLALATDPAGPADDLLPAAGHLATLAGAADLPRLRIGAYRDDPLRGWNQGRINLGLAHGVPGVVAALCAVHDRTGGQPGLTTALGYTARRLVEESFVDSRGVRTWGQVGLDGHPPPPHPSHRQAWCYGTPGVAWSLWEAGRVLADPSLRAFAADAMRSLCAAWDDELYIDDGPPSVALTICHGAAGTLAVADAFARHAGLAEAARLRAHLQRYLLDRTDHIGQLTHADRSLLTGASGVLAVLLTTMGGQRDWLGQIGLR